MGQHGHSQLLHVVGDHIIPATQRSQRLAGAHQAEHGAGRGTKAHSTGIPGSLAQGGHIVHDRLGDLAVDIQLLGLRHLFRSADGAISSSGRDRRKRSSMAWAS